jgi:hypothetical protein
MKPENLHRLLSDSEGKGLIGCILSIVLFLLVVFVGILLGPIYYNNYNFESDVKTEVSRAGARSYDNETIIKDIIDLAKRNEIRLTGENIKVDRYAGQLHLIINYSVPVDFLVIQRDIDFQINVSSFIGTL